MKKITLLLSLLFCIIGIGKTFAASPITSVTGTTKITAATALVGTKLLQKSGMRKNVVIDLIYRGFI